MKVEKIEVSNENNFLTQKEVSDETQRVFSKSVCGSNIVGFWIEVDENYKSNWDFNYKDIDDINNNQEL